MAGRRQVLSYSDAYDAPSGDVDFEQPLPSLIPAPFSIHSYNDNDDDNAEAGPSSLPLKRSPRQSNGKTIKTRESLPPPQPPIQQDNVPWGPPQSVPYPTPQHLHQQQYQRGQQFTPHVAHPHHMPPSGPRYGYPIPQPGPQNGTYPMPYYTGPPPGFQQPFNDPMYSPYPLANQRHPPHQPQGNMHHPPTGPRLSQSETFTTSQPNHTPSIPTGPRAESHMAPFHAATPAYISSVSGPSRSSSIPSIPSITSHPHRPPFVWPGSSFYDWSKIVIDDWDLSSDESDRNSDTDSDAESSPGPRLMTVKERKRHSRQTRRDHQKAVCEIFQKANAKSAPAAQAPLGESAEVKNAPVESPAPAVKDQNLLEKKQQEIKAMMERIKRLEAGKGKARAAPAAGALKDALSAAISTAAKPEAADESPPKEEKTECPSPEAAEAVIPTKRPLELDSALAEQRQRLLASMSLRAQKPSSSANQSPPAASPATIPEASTTIAKRKADEVSDDDDDEEVESQLQTTNPSDDTNLLKSASSPSAMSGKKAKRQRKKERRRAEKAAAAASVSEVEATSMVESSDSESASKIVGPTDPTSQSLSENAVPISGSSTANGTSEATLTAAHDQNNGKKSHKEKKKERHKNKDKDKSKKSKKASDTNNSQPAEA
ncbi:unnamed protein product [Sympodiomycopsis kandeliae]